MSTATPPAPAVATWTIYRYYRSEEPLASSPGAASAQPLGPAGRP